LQVGGRFPLLLVNTEWAGRKYYIICLHKVSIFTNNHH